MISLEISCRFGRIAAFDSLSVTLTRQGSDEETGPDSGNSILTPNQTFPPQRKVSFFLFYLRTFCNRVLTVQKNTDSVRTSVGDNKIRVTITIYIHCNHRLWAITS